MFHILYDAQRVPLVTSQISFLINPLHPIPIPRPHHTFTLKANSITCVLAIFTQTSSTVHEISQVSSALEDLSKTRREGWSWLIMNQISNK